MYDGAGRTVTPKRKSPGGDFRGGRSLSTECKPIRQIRLPYLGRHGRMWFSAERPVLTTSPGWQARRVTQTNIMVLWALLSKTESQQKVKNPEHHLRKTRDLFKTLLTLKVTAIRASSCPHPSHQTPPPNAGSRDEITCSGEQRQLNYSRLLHIYIYIYSFLPQR